MKTNDVQDDLQDGFEPSSLPPIGPDGAPALEPMRRLPVLMPSLCTAGPCMRYHEFSVQLDVTRPIGERYIDGGKIEGDAGPMPFHPQVHRYCYPTTGIETNLGDLPVVTCSAWRPLSAEENAKRMLPQQAFLASAAGKKFTADRDAYIATLNDGNDVAVESSNPELPTEES